ncbi:MAG: hypothetical protein NZM04_04230, partial [Methylacidiphilales bacterium]|nr:hypothetical protein [Candidatus Methylacidiphilales bacterium]
MDCGAKRSASPLSLHYAAAQSPSASPLSFWTPAQSPAPRRFPPLRRDPLPPLRGGPLPLALPLSYPWLLIAKHSLPSPLDPLP